MAVGSCCHDSECTIPNAVGACSGGRCVSVRCTDGFADCDPGKPGCETLLATHDHCGSCGDRCPGSDLDYACAGPSGCVQADARFDGPSSGNATIWTEKDGHRQGQTVTPRRSGSLVAVQVQLICSVGTGIDLEIQEAVGALPGGRVVATAHYDCRGEGGADPEHALVKLQPPAPVTAGKKIALAVSSTGPQFLQLMSARGDAANDPYPGGDASAFGFTPGAWTISPGTPGTGSSTYVAP